MASPTPTITNFRDVAQITTPSNNSSEPHQPTLNPNLFYRSALPSTASPETRANLSNTYHIETILDLRTDTEIAEQEKEQPEVSQPPSSDNDTQPQPKTTRISLNGPSYSLALIKQLPYHLTLKLALLYTIPSYRTSAIAILGKNVMTARGLSGLAIDTLTHSTAEINQIFTTVLAEPNNYPILVHCTQGKDRTGLVVLLVCLLCGLEVEGVEGDYMRSHVELEPEREERVKEIAKIGLPPSFAGCEEGWVAVVGGWLEKEWGGVEGYLVKGCGVEREVLERVRGVLVVNGRVE